MSLSGIVQGSVRSPAVFIIYINDLPDVCNECKVKLYADDVKTYKSISLPTDHSSLQYVLDAIWSIEWRLQFPIDKCQYLLISYSDAKIHNNIGRAFLTAVLFNKDLDFIINSTLKTSSHISSIIKKANARCKLFMKCVSSRDPFMLSRAYKTYVRPLLEYESPVWRPCRIGDIRN